MSLDERLARTLVRVMVRHGVSGVQSSLGRRGTLALRPDGGIADYGIVVSWLPWAEQQKLWRAVGLPGEPQPPQKDRAAFFGDLMAAMLELGVGRLVWTEETRVMFTRDSTAPSGVEFRLQNLECLPREQGSLELDIQFRA